MLGYRAAGLGAPGVMALRGLLGARLANNVDLRGSALTAVDVAQLLETPVQCLILDADGPSVATGGRSPRSH